MIQLVLKQVRHRGIAVGASAQNFSYPNFASTAGLTLNGNAAQSGSVVNVVATASQVGSVWHGAPVQVVEGFETEFAFRMSSMISLSKSTSTPGSGCSTCRGAQLGFSHRDSSPSAPRTTTAVGDVAAAERPSAETARVAKKARV